ncbi:hypothetical protein ACFFMN_23185 [Planobispora siamensis]|nr:hypothetical protein [Planobispora siamensis]
MRTKKAPKPPGFYAALFVLVFCAVVSVGQNLYHAFAIASQVTLPGLLAFGVGISPVLVAAGQSHVMAVVRMSRFKLAVGYACFSMAMVMSLQINHEVVDPFFGTLTPFGLFDIDVAWMPGIFLDVCALLALDTIVSLYRTHHVAEVAQPARGAHAAPAVTVPPAAHAAPAAPAPVPVLPAAAAPTREGADACTPTPDQSGVNAPTPAPFTPGVNPHAERARETLTPPARDVHADAAVHVHADAGVNAGETLTPTPAADRVHTPDSGTREAGPAAPPAPSRPRTRTTSTGGTTKKRTAKTAKSTSTAEASAPAFDWDGCTDDELVAHIADQLIGVAPPEVSARKVRMANLPMGTPQATEIFRRWRAVMVARGHLPAADAEGVHAAPDGGRAPLTDEAGAPLTRTGSDDPR